MGEMSIVAGREQERFYPYTGMFYANRHSFWTAGQNSWTLPPAQDQDSFLQLSNVEPVLQGVLQRRRGYTFFSQVPPSSFVHSYSFRSDGLGLRRVVWTPLSVVAGGVQGPMTTDEQGNITNNPIFTQSPTAVFAPRMVLSRDFGYFSDGTATDLVKWDGTTNSDSVTNWGISAGNSPTAVFGPNAVGLGTDLGGTGDVGWTGASNIQGPPDGSFATSTIAFPQKTDQLAGTNFGFSIPATAGPITGIQVSIKGFVSGTIDPGTLSGALGVFLYKAGTVVGTSHFTPLPTSNGFVVVGANNDLWGTSWTNSDVNASNFGVGFQASTTQVSDSFTLNIDSIQVTITCAGGSIAFTTSTTTTNVVLLNGRTYTYAFQNSTTLTTSDIGPFSVTTGPLTGNEVDLFNIPVSSDPQVDTVLILATADGNDETTLFLLGKVPNGTTTFADTIPDSLSATYTSGPTLLASLLYQDTDDFGGLHGIINNLPPPVGLNYMVKHKGRLYGAVGRALHFSKNLNDVTTAEGLITSKWEEAWPLENQFDISETAETIQGLLSDGETLWIGTERGIRRLIGDSPNNFQIPEVQFNEAGLLSQDVWKICFFEGQPVGTIWVTKDLKVMASDFNTYADVGQPIQDILNSVFTGTGSIIHASYVSLGPADYYMLYVPTAGTLPNTICVFDLRKKKWFIWRPTDLITTSLFLIDASGNPRWLFGASPSGFNPTHGFLYEWTYGTFLDRINKPFVVGQPGNLPYSVTVQTTWLDMGDYGLRKFLNQIVPTTGDPTALTIQVEAASNEQDFLAPLNVVPATTVTPAAIPDDVFVPLASGPSHHRSFRFTFVSPASQVQNVLTGFSIEAGVIHRY